ncbi:sarcosine oxidase subunit gamma [Roseibium sp.]|uniref:sarcosine oxidase subunit gamma n=1 Tax=Roseibium sp. TaxID=1936156 RepID=UPI003A97073F
MADDLVTTLYVPDAAQEPLLSLGPLSLLRAAPVARFSFRGRTQAQAVAGKSFGISLPQDPLSHTAKENRVALWLGPDEWLLLAPEDQAESLYAQLEKDLAGLPCSLVDITHRQEALLITGNRAGWLLNSGIPIDLHNDAFPHGTVTRTVFHKTPVMLWRIGPDSFVVEAWGSFMDYVEGLLKEAAQELQAD